MLITTKSQNGQFFLLYPPPPIKKIKKCTHMMSKYKMTQ